MNVKMSDRLLLTIREAAGLLGIGPTKLYQLTNAGHLRICKLGGKSMLARKDVEKLAEEVASGAVDLSGVKPKRSEAA